MKRFIPTTGRISGAPRFGGFLGDRRGNIAIMTALLALPLFGFVGFAVDYGIALADKAKLDAAADAAAIAGINTAQTVITGGGTSASATTQGQTAALSVFKANAGSIAFASVPTPKITVTPTGRVVNSTVTYATSTQASFAKIIGLPQLNVKGTSTASLTLPTYINYYVIVDMSQSMGIGSTAADMQNLFNRVVSYNNGGVEGASEGGGCVFGCHVLAPGQTYTNEYLAHSISPPITLRIDAAVTALQTMIADAQASQQARINSGSPSLIQIGIYAMSGAPSPADSPCSSSNTSPLTTISSLTSNFSALTTAAATLDLGCNTSAGVGDSEFANALAGFVGKLPAQGDGSTQAKALNYVFIITDGAVDTPGACTSGHCVSAFPPSLCTPIQAKANVGVIYTTYLPVYLGNNPANGLEVNYANLVAPIVSQIAPNLQACASAPTSLWYYEATDGPAITAGMQQLMANSAQAARLTH